VRTVELRSGTATDRDLVGYGAMALSPSGATLAAATAFRDEESYLVGRIDLWEIESGELRASLHTDPEDFVFNLSDLRFSADGSRITALANYGCAAAGFNRLITWDVAGGTVVNDEVGLPVPFDESGMPLGSQPLALAFTGDGSQATWADSERGTLLYRQGAALISIGTETLDVAAAFSPDGGLLAVADETGAVRLLDPASGQVEGSWQLEAEPRELRFSDDGSMLLVLLFNDTLVALGVGEQQERARFSVASESAGLSVSADNELLALSSPEGAHLYALPSGTSLGTLEGSFDGALLGPGRRLLATVGDGRVLLWGAP
jgi:WD40 repeat protein